MWYIIALSTCGEILDDSWLDFSIRGNLVIYVTTERTIIVHVKVYSHGAEANAKAKLNSSRTRFGSEVAFAFVYAQCDFIIKGLLKTVRRKLSHSTV